jgi:hypothetical protein
MTRSIYSLWPWTPTAGCTATMEPDVVTGLVATPSGSTTINLVWDADTTAAPNQATSYEVWRSADGNAPWTQIATVTAPTVSYSDTSLSASTTRYYRVNAVNCYDSANPSSTANATNAAGSSNIPAAPSGFTATSNFADSVSLSWTDNSASPAEDGFDIEVSTNAGSSYSSVTTTAQNATSYSHTGRVESTAYLYRIRATNTSGSSSWVTASSVTTPAAVQSFTATAASSTQINLSWTDKSGVETGFRIERSTDNSNWSLVTTTAANATSFSNTGLTASTLYYYRIRSDSYNGTNDSAWYSASATTQSGSSTYSIEYLTVAGGGGGGTTDSSGGGGAGGYRTATGFSLTVGTSYTITIGAGGAAANNGNDSVFSTITSTGGGRGANGNQSANGGGNGGSGGGAQGLGTGAAGTGTTGQGNAGGSGEKGAPYAGGGGGGANAAGQNGTAGGGPGNGGDGLASSITGSSVVRAGGGGGGTWNAGSFTGGYGGTGGGGNCGVAGTANTGGGGGGNGGWAGTSGTGKAGGSGVVILRMATANYSGTTTGSPSVTTSGSDTILTFNASGSYTA